MAYNPADQTQQQALASEIGLPAYADVPAGNDQEMATRLNLPQDTITVGRGLRSSVEVMSAIEPSEFLALTVAQRDWVIAIVSPGEVDSSSAIIRAGFASLFGAASLSRARLTAMGNKTPASRAEQLFGIGTVISAGHVARALGRA